MKTRLKSRQFYGQTSLLDFVNRHENVVPISICKGDYGYYDLFYTIEELKDSKETCCTNNES